jgi:hypothetical protein
MEIGADRPKNERALKFNQQARAESAFTVSARRILIEKWEN